VATLSALRGYLRVARLFLTGCAPEARRPVETLLYCGQLLTMSTFSRPPIVLTNVISDTVDPSADVSCKYSFDSVKSATSCEAMIRAYCRPLATTREKIQIWKDVQEESSYGLFPSNNMLQSPEMEHITVADTIDAKRLVITNIIPALSRSDSVKKGDALKVQEFTRCRVIKSYSPYSCYTYIDVDTMQGVHECEYERRYASRPILLLLSNYYPLSILS
jgi:hypothetical protein